MKRRGVVTGGLVVIAALVALWWWRGGRGEGDDVTAEVGAGESSARAVATGRSAAGVKAGDAAPGRRIAGTVVGDDGAPIAGARVTLATNRTPPIARAFPAVVTDAAGAFDFGVRAPDVYAVAATSAGLTPATKRFDSRRATPDSTQLRLVMHSCDAAIHGTIRDSAGGVVAGARLSLLVSAMASGAGVESGDDGTYELCIDPGGDEIVIAADGYATLFESANVYGRTRRDFQLVPGTSLAGRVVRASDASPVADARVELETPGGYTLMAWSGADGAFVIDGVAPRRYSVYAKADGLAAEQPTDVTVEMEHTPEVTIEMVAAMTVSGRVVEKGTEKPVGKMLVALRPSIRQQRQRNQFIATRDDGTFAIDHVLPGEYSVEVDQFESEVQPRTVTVTTQDVRDLEFEVEPRGSIAGVVRHDGRPIEGARVVLREVHRQAATAADGTFLLDHIPAGTHRLYAESQRAGAFTDRAVVTLGTGEHKQGVVVDLDLAASVAGTVVDQNGAPVAGAYVRFAKIGETDFGVATTADDGSFTARAMQGGGEYAYEVRERDGGTVYPPVSGKRFPSVAVADGQTHITGLVIRARVDRLVIAGRLVDSAGNAVADAELIARLQDDKGVYRTPRATSDQNGAFTFRDLSAGTYDVIATSTRGTVQDRVPAGRENVTLRLRTFGSIEGTLDGFSEKLDVWVSGDGTKWQSWEAWVSGRTFAVNSLPPGEYRVRALGATSESDAKVTVREGEATKVALRPRAVGSVEGTFVDAATGAPIAGAYCSAEDNHAYARPHTDTARDGTFQLRGVTAGEVRIRCDHATATLPGPGTVVTVQPGQMTRVTLRGAPPYTKTWTIGITFADRMHEVVVAAVTPGGPADRAGVTAGDIVEKIGTRMRYASQAESVLELAIIRGGPVRLDLERDDKPFTVTVTPEEKPAQPGQ